MSKPGTKINGAFVPHLRDMLASPAWRALSLSGHRVLDRLEIEHMRHAGKDNGKLPVTFADLVTHGIGDRNAIAPAIRECVALGFIEVTQRGRSGNGTFRKPNRFRLTYLPTEGAAPTHDWHALKTDNDAA
jgi:hypothetical protein